MPKRYRRVVVNTVEELAEAHTLLNDGGPRYYLQIDQAVFADLARRVVALEGDTPPPIDYDGLLIEGPD